MPLTASDRPVSSLAVSGRTGVFAYRTSSSSWAGAVAVAVARRALGSRNAAAAATATPAAPPQTAGVSPATN
jgi:hypothetical protein